MTTRMHRTRLDTPLDSDLNEMRYGEPTQYVPRNGSLALGLFGNQSKQDWTPPSSRELRSAHNPKRPWRRRAQVKTWPQLLAVPFRKTQS